MCYCKFDNNETKSSCFGMYIYQLLTYQKYALSINSENKGKAALDVEQPPSTNAQSMSRVQPKIVHYHEKRIIELNP
jgi:hypothetical protein